MTRLYSLSDDGCKTLTTRYRTRSYTYHILFLVFEMVLYHHHGLSCASLVGEIICRKRSEQNILSFRLPDVTRGGLTRRL